MKIQLILFSALALTVLQAQNIPKNVSICYEAFSLPLATAAKLHREQLTDSELYARLVAAVDKETVQQEALTVLRCKSSQRAKAESINEQIYPTEYEPAGFPMSLIASPAKDAPESDPDAQKAKKAADPQMFDSVSTPATPTAFDTRNTGATLEIEPTLSENEKLVDLRLVPEHVTMVGRTSFGQGVSITEMPGFEAQRLNTAATLHINRPFMLGTISRPPISQVDPDSANRVWFAFVTATLAKP